MVIDPLQPLVITTTGPLAKGRAGEAYTQSFATKDGSGVVKAWTAIPTPAGLRMTPKTGELTGTPTNPGIVDITIKATDTAGQTDTKVYQLEIEAAPFRIKTPMRLTDGSAEAAYAGTLEAQGGYTEYGPFAIVESRNFRLESGWRGLN